MLLKLVPDIPDAMHRCCGLLAPGIAPLGRGARFPPGMEAVPMIQRVPLGDDLAAYDEAFYGDHLAKRRLLHPFRSRAAWTAEAASQLPGGGCGLWPRPAG